MLSLKNVNAYYGRKKVTSNISFKIAPGEVVGLIGPNGSGKTTIMKAILGVAKSTGQISLDQSLITQENHRVLQNVGALIEYPAIYPFLTGRENLALYAQDTPKMNKLINRLEMTSYIDRKAKGYSVGMRQKLGIAMALLDDPELVILDEPMNGLDIEATILVRKIISDYAKQGTAFLISSHVLSELQKIMTKVLILNQGQIILNTSMNKIMQLQARQYWMQTSDQEAASRVLLESNIEVKQSDNNYLILTKKDLKKAQHELASNHIWLTALIPDGASFEKIVVEILKKKRAEIK